MRWVVATATARTSWGWRATPGRVLFGPAVTIAFFPSCAASVDPAVHDFRSLFREAVGDDSEGKVLVLATNGHPGVSVGGGTKLGRVHHYGLDGVLTDGRLRDFTELRTYGFTSYCAGEAVEAGGALITPHRANVPVVLRGVGVMPGDYVFADGSGAVIIPAAEIDEILLGAIAVGRRTRIASRSRRNAPVLGEHPGRARAMTAGARRANRAVTRV